MKELYVWTMVKRHSCSHLVMTICSSKHGSANKFYSSVTRDEEIIITTNITLHEKTHCSNH